MTPEEWAQIKYFDSGEFDSPDSPGSGLNMRFAFVQKLDGLREAWGAPLTVNSGYRTIRHNALVGGKPNSAHTDGEAADLRPSENPKLEDCIKLAIVAARMGFRRIGVDLKGRYVHVDSSTTLPAPATWFYA